MVLKSVLKSLLGGLGNATAVLLFLSPMKTYYEIWKRNATEDFSIFPYQATLANCVMWIFYGIVKGHSPLVLSINGFGCIIELMYIILYFRFANKHQRIHVFGVTSTLFCATGAIIGGIIGGTHSHHVRLLIIGIICAGLNAIMNLAPLSIIGLVIKTKSVEYMPFLLSFFVLLNSVVWFFYALVTKDVYIMVPNGIGIIFGMAQLILYFIYKPIIVALNKVDDAEMCTISNPYFL